MRKAVVALGLAFALLAGLQGSVQAQPPTLQLNSGPQLDAFLQSVGMSRADLETFLTTKLDQLFQVSNAGGFLRNFGDAQGFTSKGLGVDYASEATYAEVGGAAAFALGMNKTYQPGNAQGFPIQGVGLNATVMGGFSFGFLGVPLMVFGNWMRVPTRDYGQMSGSLNNWGVHAQLRLFGPSRENSALKMLVRWGGIAITTGIDSSHMTLGLKQDFASSFQLPAPPAGYATGYVDLKRDVAGAGSAQFDVNMMTKTIPLELTTSLRLLTLLSLYGGMGFDFRLDGWSSMDVTVNAAMTGRIPATSLTPASSVDLGSATVTASAREKPSPAKVRGIFGAQVNLWLVRLFVQFNVANTHPTMASLAAGLRVAY
jgi:hypothetical protein